MSKISKLLEYIDNVNEAEDINLESLPLDKQKFVKNLNLDKIPKQMLDNSKVSFDDGHFGTILDINKAGELRLTKKELKNIISDSLFRWIDVRRIGF